VKPRIAVLGSINMDLMIRCPILPRPGETIAAESSVEICGGKGANQAVAAARAGGNVTMIGRLGDDAFNSRLRQNLHNDGIDTQHVLKTPDCPSGLAVVAVEHSGENSILLVPGANALLSPADVQNARTVIESSDALLVQLEIPTDTVAAALDIANSAGVRVILDPAPAPRVWVTEFNKVDLLCPNESEAAVISGSPVTNLQQAALVAAQLQNQIRGDVIITMGEEGSVLCTQQGTTTVPAFPTNPVDTTGAGDAFAGALAVHWAGHNDLAAAVRFANAAGALATTRPGAQSGMASQTEIESLQS
jgi:ribokinase